MAVRGVEYIDYEKISDDLCWLGNKCMVRMNVKLANKAKDGTRYHFHKEYRYQSSYIYNPELITLRRSFEYYISIDHLESKENVIIGINDIILLRMKLNDVYNLLFGNTFAIKNNKLIIAEKKKPVIVDGLLGMKSLTFEPIIYTDMQDKQSKGVRVVLNNSDSYSDIPVNAFMGFMYLINSINMFDAAQNMINYLGNPGLGYNLYTYERPQYTGDKQVTDNSIKDRKIPMKNANNNISFFDKMDDM